MKKNNRPEYISSILCEKAIIDQVSNNVSAIEIVSSFKIVTGMNLTNLKEKGYILPIKPTLLTIWRKDFKGEFKGKEVVNIIDPLNKHLARTNLEFNIPSNSKSHTTITTLEGIPITVEGTYKFEIGLESENNKIDLVSTYFLEIEISNE